MTWGGIKKGDTVIEVYADKVSKPAVVVRSVGKRWITTQFGERFNAKTGRGDYPREIHTQLTLAEKTYKARLCRLAARYMGGSHWIDLPVWKLEAIVAVLISEAGSFAGVDRLGHQAAIKDVLEKAGL